MADEIKRNFELSFFERLVKENPNYVDALIPLAEMYTRMGFYEKGLRIDERLAALKKHDPTVRYNLACSLALLNRKTEALSALQRAIKLGYSDFEHMKRDRDLKNLRDHPKFKAFGNAGPTARHR